MPQDPLVTRDITDIQTALACLRAGGVVAFPTETVYGLGADAENPAAVAGVYALKGRPATHPVIVHLTDASQMARYAAAVPEVAQRLAAAFWPGPLTLILRRSAQVPDAVTGGQDTVGLRVPAHRVAQALLRAFGRGVAAPSANRFGHVSPTTAAHVRDEFAGTGLLVLDGGACPVGIESTIVDVSGRSVRLLRPGGISRAAIETVIGRSLRSGARGTRAPGLLARHYAPETPLELVAPGLLARRFAAVNECDGRTGVLRCGPADARFPGIALPADPAGYSQGLYAALRALDAHGYARVLVEAPPRTAPWRAVHDRLGRAARGRAPGA